MVDITADDDDTCRIDRALPAPEQEAMARTILGTLTVGQAPRPDVTPILDRHLPDSVERIHRGLLDGLLGAAIAAAYAVEAGDAVLVTRLADGSSVELSARKVQPALQGKLDELEAAGCNVVLLLCTGAFHGLHLRRGFLLEPDRIIPPAVAGMMGARRIGIIVPLASQIVSESGKWRALEREPVFAAASPYTSTPDALTAAGASLARKGAEALLLDCIGFVEAHRRALARACNLPVILSNSLVARFAGEMVG
jgi:protein AroM